MSLRDRHHNPHRPTLLMRNRIWISLPIVALLLLIALLGWWYGGLRANGPPQTPPAAMVNDNPYVSDDRCAECHADQAKDYQTSGHASTFYASASSPAARWLDGKSFDDPERPYAYEYHFDEATGLAVSIPKQFGDDRFQLPYVLGSGHHALTFLSLVPDQLGDTTGVEHRVTLYRHGDGWELDLTPGHRLEIPRQQVEHFGKVLRGDKLTSCIGCHTTQGEIVRQQIENLSPHVGCQNCHGPGREHVTAMENDREGGAMGFAQQTAREEVEMCGRCHRLAHSESGAEVSPNDIRIVRFQSVGLLQSRCFNESGEQLRCTTCHDPHQTVSRDASHYVNRCLDCHGQPNSAPCPVSPQSNCIGCHMPAINIHRGIKFHDHWIRVRSDLEAVTDMEADAP